MWQNTPSLESNPIEELSYQFTIIQYSIVDSKLSIFNPQLFDSKSI